VSRICMLYLQDHTRHSIICRQIATLLKAGYAITILDSSDGTIVQPLAEYTRVIIRPVRLWLFRKWIWKLLRPFAIGCLSEAYWTVLICTELILTSVWYMVAAHRCDADVYQVHDLWTLFSAILVGRLRKRPVIYDAHELASEQGDSRSLYNRFLRLLEWWFIPRADRVIVPNHSRARVYMEEHRLKAEPLVVLNCPPMMQLGRTNLLRQTLGLPGSVKVVLYHGALMPGRALEELLCSSHYFNEGIILVIIGEQNTYYQQVLYPLWRSAGLQGVVFFLPYMPHEEIMPYVASADLGVVIYKNINRNNYLCAPTKLYEYFMANVPVVACDFPEICNLLREYPVGLTFNPDEPFSIAAAINAFFRGETIRRLEIGKYLDLARQRFNWEIESPKLLNLFVSLTWRM